MNDDLSQKQFPPAAPNPQPPSSGGIARLVPNPKLKSLRTYQGDIEEAMSKNKTSLVTVAVAEQKRNEKEGKFKVIEKAEIKNKTFVVLGFTFLILSAIVIGAVYFTKKYTAPLVVDETKTILTYSKIHTIPGGATRQDVLQHIITEKSTLALPINEIEYIRPEASEGTLLGTETFLSLLSPTIPAPLVRSFNPSTYMLGIYSFDSNAPFLILKTDDFGGSYAGMLTWESTMPIDLATIFNIETGSTTTYAFKDESIHNKDLRILKDSYGKTVLLYSFIDKNTLIITSNEGIFNALLGKYQTTQLIR